jgi:hypothetical protein
MLSWIKRFPPASLISRIGGGEKNSPARRGAEGQVPMKFNCAAGPIETVKFEE